MQRQPHDMHRHPDYYNDNDRRPVANVNVDQNPYALGRNNAPAQNFHPRGLLQQGPFSRSDPSTNYTMSKSITVHIGDKSAQRYFMVIMVFTAIMTVLFCLVQPPCRGVVYVGDPTFSRFDSQIVFAFRTAFQNEKDADHTNEDIPLEFQIKEDDHLPFWHSLFFSNMASVAVNGVKYDRKDLKSLGDVPDMHLEFGRNTKRSFHMVHKLSATSSTTFISRVIDIDNIDLFPADQNACLTFDAYGWRYLYKVTATNDCKNIYNALQRWTTADFFHDIPFPEDQTPPKGIDLFDIDYGLKYGSEHNSFLFLLNIFTRWDDDEMQIAGWVTSITYKKTGKLDDNLESLLVEGYATSGPFSFYQEDHTYALMTSIDLFNSKPRYLPVVAAILPEDDTQKVNPFRLIDDQGIHIETIMTMPNAMFYYRPAQRNFGFHRGDERINLRVNNFKTVYSEVGEVCMKIVVATKGKPSEFFMMEGCEALKSILEQMHGNVLSLKEAQSEFNDFEKRDMYGGKKGNSGK